MPAPRESQDWVEVGRVARAHGIRGELRVKLHNADSDILSRISEILVRLPDLTDRVVGIRSARTATPGIVLLSLDGIDDRSASEALQGALLLVPRDALPGLDEGEFYVHDLIGAQVITSDGVVIGKVIDYVTYPTADVIVVQGDKRYEIPMLDDFIRELDTGSKRVVVDAIDDFETS